MSSRVCRVLTTISVLLWAASLGLFCSCPYLTREMLGIGFSDSFVTVWNLDGVTAQHWLGCTNAVPPTVPGSLQDLGNVTRWIDWRLLGIKIDVKMYDNATSHWTVWINLWWPLTLFAIPPVWILSRRRFAKQIDVEKNASKSEPSAAI